MNSCDDYIGPDEYPFLAEIRLTGDWRETLRARFLDHEVTLTENGLIVSNDTVFGAFGFLEIDQVRVRFEKRRWFQEEHESASCPFIPPTAGYFHFSFDYLENYDGTEGIRQEALLCLIREARGLLIRLPADRWTESVVRRPFSLLGLESKWGFDDGDAFLTRSAGSYAREAVRTIEAAFHSHGYTAWIGWNENTCHNPLSFQELERQGRRGPCIWKGTPEDFEIAEPVWDPGAILADLDVSLWAYNNDPLEDLDFWKLS